MARINTDKGREIGHPCRSVAISEAGFGSAVGGKFAEGEIDGEGEGEPRRHYHKVHGDLRPLRRRWPAQPRHTLPSERVPTGPPARLPPGPRQADRSCALQRMWRPMLAREFLPCQRSQALVRRQRVLQRHDGRATTSVEAPMLVLHDARPAACLLLPGRGVPTVPLARLQKTPGQITDP